MNVLKSKAHLNINQKKKTLPILYAITLKQKLVGEEELQLSPTPFFTHLPLTLLLMFMNRTNAYKNEAKLYFVCLLAAHTHTHKEMICVSCLPTCLWPKN